MPTRLRGHRHASARRIIRQRHASTSFKRRLVPPRQSVSRSHRRFLSPHGRSFAVSIGCAYLRYCCRCYLRSFFICVACVLLHRLLAEGKIKDLGKKSDSSNPSTSKGKEVAEVQLECVELEDVGRLGPINVRPECFNVDDVVALGNLF
ncbi:hypothetical protein KSP39_PZI020707 [Platanthera zijinensis]|uniref:Uncharacterized protein n=1 Tax=Platanthera zijinensis TaxID=2320716 RepID=A0AAP0B041_9ASPA